MSDKRPMITDLDELMLSTFPDHIRTVVRVALLNAYMRGALNYVDRLKENLCEDEPHSDLP